ncbi:leucyl aminopeptidase family protein [Luteolibacter ambystomatis]|uniref:Leucyl aminopeptidase family protein n=1 Tax=Luteolibacter ambystomatis TaxID=2824561 RepID=A0A975G828_9BACT|nr:leucyl aminopeptidase family protein [Luteolibacter ambystomatis]QUE51057.1 leucyl aminopeptidase family protein [Luteolibacter ambystomatis]
MSVITLRRSKASATQAVAVLLPAGEVARKKLSAPLAAALKDIPLSAKQTRTLVDAKGRVTVFIGIEENAGTAALRLGAVRAVKAMQELNVGDFAFDLFALADESPEDAAVGQALAEGLAIATFDSKPFAGTASAAKADASLKITLDPRFHAGFKTGLLLGQAVNTARMLSTTPPNIATPEWMTARAKDIAKTHGMPIRVIGAAEAKKLSMGGLLAVGAGSVTPPRMVVMEWNPSKKKTAPVLLVGKTMTYDSGGLSIKADGGKGMKVDKAGGCTMLAVMEALALLKVKTRVVCILAAAENMIDSTCYRLDDVITHANGVTCEITNTDAEGRLVLADALAWGTKTYKPSAVIDAATLTGGVLVALGRTITGVFSNNDELVKELEDASRQADERVWRLPLDESLRDQMRAGVADLHNSSPYRYSHAGTGAAYLSFFVGEDAPKSMPVTPWLHLDLAGTAVSDGDHDWQGLYPKGPTGWGVRTLTALLAGWEKR